MGATPKSTTTKTLIGEDMAKLYSGGYGHNPSGKLYTYWGSDNYRTGQNVNVPVTNPKTGKTYNTMLTIMETRSPNTTAGAWQVYDLESKGIDLKWINGSDVSNLPSYPEYGSKSAWAEQSRENWLTEAKTRLGAFDTSQTDQTEAVARLTQLGV